MADAGNTQVNDLEKPGEARIAKIIARSGLCSRREAEEMILAGRVTLNGAKVATPAINVSPADRILVDGRPLPKLEPPRLWRYHKPKGRVTTHRDPEGRPTVFDDLPEGMPRVITVGRLDFNTEGLLLLTNDGELARHLELPATGWARRYRIRAHGEIDQAALDRLAGGLTVDGIHYGPIEARLDREQGGNVWITASIREGKNREIRRIMEHLGLTVNRLIRVSYGPFMLGDLEPGEVEEVRPRVLIDQLGPAKAAELGVEPGNRRPQPERAPVRSRPQAPAYLKRARQERQARQADRRGEKEPRTRLRRILPMDPSSGEPVRIEKVPVSRRRGGRDRDNGAQGLKDAEKAGRRTARPQLRSDRTSGRSGGKAATEDRVAAKGKAAPRRDKARPFKAEASAGKAGRKGPSRKPQQGKRP